MLGSQSDYCYTEKSFLGGNGVPMRIANKPKDILRFRFGQHIFLDANIPTMGASSCSRENNNTGEGASY